MKFTACLFGILFLFNMGAQTFGHLDFRPAKKSNVLSVKTGRFKVTASTKPTNKFVSNSTVTLSGLSYDVRMKFYVNHRLSLVMKTKSPSTNSRDVASFGIIFKFGKWKKH